MNKPGYLLLLCLTHILLIVTFCSNHGLESHSDCGMDDPPQAERERSVRNEVFTFGKPVGEMNQRELSSLFDGLHRQQEASGQRLQDDVTPTFTLRDIPIVYHILRNQDNGGDGFPKATSQQLDYMTRVTNEMYNIYDKGSGQSVQFTSFVWADTVVHEDEIDVDCNSIPRDTLREFVTRVDEWEFKLHAVICESSRWSGVASFPWWFEDADPLHNMVRIEYRAIACYDEFGTFLCDLTEEGEEASHTRWWRTASRVYAHEVGHLFGLLHTFSSHSCSPTTDLVGDTPAEVTSSTNTCGGLLPYDRDRDLFDDAIAATPNPGSVDTCGGADKVCGSTCAACCLDCEFYDAGGLESIPEGDYEAPYCCNQSIPEDSCPDLPGIDPKNNVMSYVPDWCIHEFTPGQMIRMMAEVRGDKSYIYCNYADVWDPEVCASVPCGSTGTNANCGRVSCGFGGRCESSFCSPRECVDGYCSGVDECPDASCSEPACSFCAQCRDNEYDCSMSGCTFEADVVQKTCGDFATRFRCRAVPGCEWEGFLWIFGRCEGTPSVSFGQCSGEASSTCE